MTLDPKVIEVVARAMCHSVNPCNSMVAEIMDQPSYAPGCEGDAHHITTAGRFREDAKAAITAYLRAREAQGYVEACWQPMETAPYDREVLIKGGQRWRDSDDYKERSPHTGPSLATYDKFRRAWCIGNEETLHECYWCENPTGWLDPQDLLAARPQKETENG